MSESICFIEDVTTEAEACFEAHGLIAEEFGINMARYATFEELRSKVEIDLMLAAYADETKEAMIGSLVAHEFGNRVYSMAQSIKAQRYETAYSGNWKLADWRHQSWPAPTYTLEVRPRPAALYGLKIDYLTVDKSVRHQGVGRRLVEAAVSIARQRGAEEVTLRQVYEAGGFYDRLGFDPPPVKSNERRFSLNR